MFVCISTHWVSGCVRAINIYIFKNRSLSLVLITSLLPSLSRWVSIVVRTCAQLAASCLLTNCLQALLCSLFQTSAVAPGIWFTIDAALVETGTVSSCLVAWWLLEPGTLTLALWVVQGQTVRYTFLLFLFVELLSFLWNFENIKACKQRLGSCSWDPGAFYLGAVLLNSFGAWEIPLLRRLGGRQSSPPSDEVPLPSSVNVSLLIWDRSTAPIQKHRDYEDLHLALGMVGTGWRSWTDSRLFGWWQSGGVRGCCL